MPCAKPIRLTGMLLLAGSFAGCSSVPTATGCSSLAESILTTATPHATLSNSGDAAQDWREYGLQETSQLNKANDDKRTGFAIIAGCEARDAEIKRQIERPWFSRLWPG